MKGIIMKNNIEKPYNRCLLCHHRIEKRCDGPRTSSMSLAQWCEFMRDLKEINGLTNAYIAEKSGVSVKTIERLIALNTNQDIMRETARLIEEAIMGISQQYPCYLAYEELLPDNTQQLAAATADLERALADNKDYRVALDGIHASYHAEIQMIREDAQKKIDYLITEIERLRIDVEHWRAENDRKGRLIDKYLEKMISK